MNARKFSVLFIIILALASTLANTALLGIQTLTSFFSFTLFASLLVIGIFLLTAGCKPVSAAGLYPIHFGLFALLGIYIFVQGEITGAIGLTAYYWAAGTVFLFGIGRWLTLPGNENVVPLLLKGICLLAMGESMIVLLQWLHILPSKNSLFSCTGTWVNPNVTAVFLAMALYAVLRSARWWNRMIVFGTLVMIFIAIILLQCRTALIVCLIFLAGHYGNRMISYCVQKTGAGKKWFIVAFVAGFLLLGCIVSFSFKTASTAGRWEVWKNCFSLVAERPLLGHGFDLFEKDYNLFVAENQLHSNGYVNMPYNDFIQLAVEGGFIAFLVWVAFLLTALQFYLKNKRPVWPLVAFVFVQLVNFGFQSIPAFLLFLLYVAIDSRLPVIEYGKRSNRKLLSPAVGYLVPFIALLLFVQQVRLSHAFYQKARIPDYDSPREAIAAYNELEQTLYRYPSYHEACGDAFLSIREYAPAQHQYLLAAQSSSRPDIFSKCGYCYQQQGRYDSSEYYYDLVQRIEPDKFAPRMALLKLYQQKGDSVRVQQKVQEILNMPVKTANEKVDRIKAYASRLININHHQ